MLSQIDKGREDENYLTEVPMKQALLYQVTHPIEVEQIT